MSVSMIFMMADGKHLFVSAEGAGYVIDAKSRTLVEEIGTEVAGVMRDDTMTLFVVNYNGMRLEAFGRTGRLWKTTPSVPEDFDEWRTLVNHLASGAAWNTGGLTPRAREVTMCA